MIIGILSLLFVVLYVQKKIATFTIPAFASVSSYQPPAKLVSFKGSVDKNKIVLQWVVKENETADQFVVEKSIDGKNFKMAALVFGTDKPETDNYEFYEKANNKKVSYRIKLVSKNQETEYSPVVEINPSSKNS